MSLFTDFFGGSLDRTVRTYSFPDLVPEFVLGAHRAAVNAVSISKTLIVSGSGDRSIRLWDAETGQLLRTFENHHSRGYVYAFLLDISSVHN
jgi:F-box and WD-40 domain protein 1/11